MAEEQGFTPRRGALPVPFPHTALPNVFQLILCKGWGEALHSTWLLLEGCRGMHIIIIPGWREGSRCSRLQNAALGAARFR